MGWLGARCARGPLWCFALLPHLPPYATSNVLGGCCVAGKKFAFHLLPSGVIYPHTKNLLGNGVVVDFEALFQEL